MSANKLPDLPSLRPDLNRRQKQKHRRQKQKRQQNRPEKYQSPKRTELPKWNPSRDRDPHHPLSKVQPRTIVLRVHSKQARPESPSEVGYEPSPAPISRPTLPALAPSLVSSSLPYNDADGVPKRGTTG